MNLLFIGDVMARPGRRAVQAFLPSLREELHLDAVIANGENLAGGAGLTRETAQELFQAGVDGITGGNHLFDKQEGMGFIAKDPRVVRPANYPPGTPGRELLVVEIPQGRLGVGCVLGRIFMKPIDDPFRAADQVWELARAASTDFFLLDVHAEASSEKMAMGWHFDGRASLVAGTHTHVPTADERILEQGTAFVTDAGMTGPYDSVIGMEKEPVLEHMRTGLRRRFRPASGNVWLWAIHVELDDSTGLARSITRIKRHFEE